MSNAYGLRRDVVDRGARGGRGRGTESRGRRVQENVRPTNGGVHDAVRSQVTAGRQAGRPAGRVQVVRRGFALSTVQCEVRHQTEGGTAQDVRRGKEFVRGVRQFGTGPPRQGRGWRAPFHFLVRRVDVRRVPQELVRQRPVGPKEVECFLSQPLVFSPDVLENREGER